ncbi:MAG: hypothetical protein ACRD0S_07835 [Acidimicrobiales bacterium]
MVAELGNFFAVMPYMLFTIAGLLVIFYVLREGKGPSVPNLTARRKHPLRHLQVELNKARKVAQEKEAAEKGEENPKEPETPRREPRRNDGPRRLRRLK